ncbi:HdeD family acid-resistance protein [Nocardia stercoris]|uniref:HdeD family acid-resistance protein n=1 Tax=Nocardia stercoris TaxID=2483361 RepID=A0A3M2LE89_9NOCA|nr:DUF308 domain-containing protein [Nocardia stercoris]RMI35366.1 HdeD family acid-resistance protein [Nocardia stercoris]
MSNATYVPESPLHALARGAWQSELTLGLLSVVLGIIILAWPGPSLLVAGVLFGIYLIVSGVLQLVSAFGPHVGTGFRVMALISGALSLILAFFAFRHVGNAIFLLAIWIGISWLFRGISALIAAADAPSGTPGRGWAIFFGILVLIGGFMLMAWPISSIATLTLAVGITMIVLGVMEFISGFQLRSAANHL